MTRKEGLESITFSFERLKLRSHIDLAVVILADIEGNHADRVACY